jgi:hypothetical protein
VSKALNLLAPSASTTVTKYSSIRIAVGFVLLLSLLYFGYQFISSRIIDSKAFPELKPGRVTLLGIQTGAGYKVIVSNDTAQLVQTSDAFGPGEMSDNSDAGGDKRRIPLKEMLQSLQGDTIALGKLVTALSDDLRKAEIPPNPVIWDSADINRAIGGDVKLRSKLTHDLNADLNGKPADFININALYNGIVLRVPVPVNVNVEGNPQKLVAKVLVPFRAAFTRNVERALQDKGLRPNDETIKGYYLQEVQRLGDKPANFQNIATALKNNFSPETTQQYASNAERILSKAKVVLNETLVTKADMQENTSQTGKPLFDLILDLKDEGRQRLWQYSRHQGGTQLLLIVEGIAIAAPRIRHELAQSNITITQMPDRSLVEETVDLINKVGTRTATNG